MSNHDENDISGVIMRPPLLFLGLALIVMAVSLMGSALVRFRRADTHVETLKPSIALITDGPYRVTRNPIYVAFGLAFRGSPARSTTHGSPG